MISIPVGVAKNKLPYYLHLVEEKRKHSIQKTFQYHEKLQNKAYQQVPCNYIH